MAVAGTAWTSSLAIAIPPSGIRGTEAGIGERGSAGGSAAAGSGKLRRGAESASIFLDWEPIDGASSYQVDWYSDAAMTHAPGGMDKVELSSVN